ncbi:TetR/AcrR family transcriptional regulator [Halocella sp. SP3-1]|nr:TetR/AcrR family transcriptional regulator [Halocella sp. SP3-1]
MGSGIMPKKIKNLRGKIIDSSLKLFKENSYQDVCMKSIADELGIAVGTIYNYFPTKWDLFLKIFEENWDMIYHKLSHETSNIKKEYLKTFFTILYKEMCRNKVIVKKIFRYIHENNDLHKDKKNAIDKIRFNEIIFTKVYDLFLINFKRDYSEVCIDLYQEELKKLFIIIQTSIPTLLKFYAKNQEANIQFILDLLQSYTENNIL